MSPFETTRLVLATALFAVLALLTPVVAPAQDAAGGDENGEEAPDLLSPGTFSGLALRGIGPATTSGRIGDFALHPDEPSTWWVAVASGGVWKSDNAGTTWSSVFDGAGTSYSIGCLAIDPDNPQVVWVGTGENNSQRSVSYGDGVYKTVDGGKSWENVGLEDSEHVGEILVDPRDTDTVYVAAQGPLWRSGGDRGLYKTTDGGESWELVLEISPDTGVSDVAFDPRDPDVLYAAAYQRRRHVWTLIDGGPESGIHKSTDGGETWTEIDKGLPSTHMGRIGLAISPQRPNVLYAIVEAADDEGGFFRSTDAGASWVEQSDYVSGSPQYYQEIVPDPHRFDRLYSMDTYMQVTEDGGKTWEGGLEANKHVDNHALWIDPHHEGHLINGNDGGVYESWDGGKTWEFFANLPITQFYKVAVGNDGPFYTVCGGTQDNATQCGPSATRNVNGIANSDWYVPVFGDGFDPAIDPTDSDIIYAQWQYGGLVRYDHATGETLDIKPRESAEGPPLRWNWDSALLISPHDHERLYYGAQILFRSDDRGNSWEPVSDDLTRNMDRNRLEIMGRVWSVDAVAKNVSTSFYGTIVALTESPLVEGLLYVGTDDGLVQVSEDGGGSWTRHEEFPGVPEMTYVNDLEASLHDADTVFAAFNNHKMGDFTPYVLESTDRGQTWTSITGDLPERGSVYALKQDHEDPDILFAGTEFGIFVTLDGGESWHEMSGVPTVAIRDIEIQRQEDDVVLASFGRGFYVLDDYSPLRQISEETMAAEAAILPVDEALAYIQSSPMALDGKAFQGAGFYLADNPPFGATFTYWMKESLRTRRAERREEELKQAGEGADVFYPAWEELKAEDREEDPQTFLVVRDVDGNVVRRVQGSTSKGLHRATWDLRYPGYSPVSQGSDGFGPMVVPGEFTVELASFHRGEIETLTEPVPFRVTPLYMPTLDRGDREATLAFQHKTGELQRAVMGANAAVREAAERIDLMKAAVERHRQVPLQLRDEVREMEIRLLDLQESLTGDPTRPRRSEPAMPGIMSRVQNITSGHWSTTAPPTETMRQGYEIAADEFEAILGDLTRLVEADLPALQQRLEEAGVPWIPGQGVPRWQRQ
ncbi:MAG: VPS10 domain-containing protein [Acidobacteriota bacterium]